MESDYKFHLGVLVFGVVLCFAFLIFIFGSKKENYLGDYWWKLFSGVGLLAKEIDNLTHNEDTWFYNGSPTCVAFDGSAYDNHESIKNSNDLGVAKSIKNFIRNSNNTCPIIY